MRGLLYAVEILLGDPTSINRRIAQPIVTLKPLWVDSSYHQARQVIFNYMMQIYNGIFQDRKKWYELKKGQKRWKQAAKRWSQEIVSLMCLPSLYPSSHC